jgi:hypothetical protein
LDITSDSGLTFKVYSGNFVFDLHYRFSASDYQTQDPSLSTNFIRLENTPGVKVDWDLNKLILSLGYDHDMMNSLSGNFQYSDGTSELLTGRAAFLGHGQDQFGLEAGGGTTTYDQNILDNNTHFTVGPFYQTQFTPHLSANAHAGIAVYEFDHNGTVANVSDFEGYYASLSLSHIVNDWFSQSFSAGRRIEEGITANLSETYFAEYQAGWKIFRNVGSSFTFEFDHGTLFGGAAEVYDQYGPTLAFSYQINEKLGATVTYGFLEKEAGASNLGFSQNRILIDFKYAF